MTISETLRRFYAHLVTTMAGVSDARVIDAFATVERERFVGPGPWQIPVQGGYMSSGTDDPAILYQDINIGLDPARGVNNGQPSLHAKCLDAVRVTAGDVVLHVGAGTGYYTAMLATLAGPSGRVHAYEIDPDLAARAARNLGVYETVTVHAESALGVELASADVIYVSAGATHIPSSWLMALSSGGRLVMPLTPNDGVGFMLLVTRRAGSAFEARSLSSAVFIPCTGARDEEESAMLTMALRSRSPEAIRSLRLGSKPDETAWCVWRDSWLSTAPSVGRR